jgi:hypothetical protein
MIIDLAKAVRVEHEVARRGGLNLKRSGNELVGACPQCGGVDRFAVSISKQLWHCRACTKGGDVISLVEHLDSCDFRTAVRTLGGWRAETTTVPVREHRQNDLANQVAIDRGNTQWALKLWDDASPIGTLVKTYFNRRGLHDLPGDDVVRFHAACPYGKTRTGCLLTLYRNITTDLPQAIARTALTATGAKIGRLSLGPTKGAAVKIDDDTCVERGLVLGEGLETGLAGRQLGFRPAWALGSAGAIRNFPVLGGIDALTVLVDNDEPDQRGRRAGQEAAWECVKRWRSAGCEVNVVLPKIQGSDIADYFGGQR